MAAKGYATQADVEAYLGVALSAEQIAAFTLLLPAAEEFIDSETGRAWLEGDVTDEAHYPDGPLVFLSQRPVGSITAVTGRAGLTGAITTLTAGTDYELRADGVLYVPGWQSYDRLLVSYTTDDASVPARVLLLTVLLITWWMRAATAGDGLDPGAIKRFRLPDLEIEYATGGGQGVAAALGIPDPAQRILNSLKRKTAAFA